MVTRKLLTIALVILSLSACNRGGNTGTEPSPTASPSNTHTAPQILRVGNGDEPISLDPQLGESTPDSRIADAQFEGLIKCDSQTLEPKPAVAKSWQVSADGTVYTFTLRPEAKWSNGDPVTAHDFVFSYKRILTPEFGSVNAHMLFIIKGARAYFEKSNNDFQSVGIKALDDHTLQLELESPKVYFLPLLSFRVFFPVPQKAIAAVGDVTDRTSKWILPEHIVTNGPFVLKSWVPNSKVVVKKSPTYWNRDVVALDEIEFYPVQNLQQEERMFRGNELDVTYKVQPDKVELYKKNNPEQLHLSPWFAMYYYYLNTTRPPLDNKLVRQALAMAIDREQIVKTIAKAGQVPFGGLVPPDTLGYTSPVQVHFDVAAAKARLAEAGYPDGNGLPKITIQYNTSDEHKPIAEAIQQMWKTHLGINVDLLNVDWKVHIASTDALDYQVARMGWIGDYLSPYQFMNLAISYSGDNRTGWKNSRYDALVEEAGKVADVATANAKFAEAEAIVLDEMPIIPIYVNARSYLIKPHVKGWANNILDWNDYSRVRLER